MVLALSLSHSHGLPKLVGGEMLSGVQSHNIPRQQSAYVTTFLCSQKEAASGLAPKRTQDNAPLYPGVQTQSNPLQLLIGGRV